MITEGEFNQKMEAGEIEEVKGDSPQSSPEEKDTKTILEPSIEDYEAALEELRLPKSRIRAYPSATATITNLTATKVVLNTEDFDEQGEFDSTTNYRFTVKREGYYLIIGHILYESNIVVDKVYIVSIYKNGSELDRFYNQSSLATQHLSAEVTTILKLKTDDYIELFTTHNAGSDQTLSSGSKDVYLAIHKLSR